MRCEEEKKQKAQGAILTLNSDYQIETEADAPWRPKSVLSFVDCLDSIRVLMIFVEMGSESAVSKLNCAERSKAHESSRGFDLVW